MSDVIQKCHFTFWLFRILVHDHCLLNPWLHQLYYCRAASVLHSSGLRSEYPYAVTTVQKWFLSAACNVAIFILVGKKRGSVSKHPPDSSHMWYNKLLQCRSMSVGRGEGGREQVSLFLLSIFLLLRKILRCLHDGLRPFWSGRLVLGIKVDWEPGAVRSETAAVPSALQTHPQGSLYCLHRKETP